MKLRRDGAGAVLILDEAEQAALGAQLRDVLAQLTRLGPGDPVWERLHPAVMDDAQATAEFRSMVDVELDAERAARMTACLEQLRGAVTGRRGKATLALSAEQLERWINAVNDLRLMRGTALGVTAENSGRWDPRGPDVAQWAIYHWLTGLQDALISALL